ATFIVLARKAAKISPPDLLPNWLYGVACRVACEARAAVAKRRAREVPAADPAPDRAPTSEPGEDPGWRLPLDEELGRLPEKYRAPLVLCYLQGKSNAEAAAALGCPLRTMEWRLARARDLLRDRLARRGVALPTAALTTLVAGESVALALPVGLV